ASGRASAGDSSVPAPTAAHSARSARGAPSVTCAGSRSAGKGVISFPSSVVSSISAAGFLAAGGSRVSMGALHGVPIMGTHLRSVAGALFGRGRLAVLGVLFQASSAPLRLREIVRRARVGTGAVQRELERLRAAGLVVRQRRGREVHFRGDRAAPLEAEVESR